MEATRDNSIGAAIDSHKLTLTGLSWFSGVPKLFSFNKSLPVAIVKYPLEIGPFGCDLLNQNPLFASGDFINYFVHFLILIVQFSVF
jgi:hypothetical protein